MPQADGSQKAVEIHISPKRCAAPARAIVPGICAGSTMTNATVAQMVKGVDGNEITLKYKGETKRSSSRQRR